MVQKVNVYIDGFNLYHAVDTLDDYSLKWVNMYKLAENMVNQGELVGSVYFFTAIWKFEQTKQRRHQNFIDGLKAMGVTVVEGKFSKPKKYCYTQQRYCPFREEKQTDVGIGVQMVHDAMAGLCDAMILITADSDQIPTMNILKKLPFSDVRLFYPPGRQQEARDLGNHVPFRKELSVGQMKNCQMPRSVTDRNGDVVATKPALYG